MLQVSNIMRIGTPIVFGGALSIVACSGPVDVTPGLQTEVGEEEPVVPAEEAPPIPTTTLDGGATPTVKDGGGKDSGGKDGGGTSGVNLTTCTGTAWSSGSINGTTPAVTTGSVASDASNGGLKLLLQPKATITANDVVIGLYFRPIPGQLDYSPNGTVGCAVLRYTGSAWSVVDKTQLCELHFSQLTHATAAGTCNGMLAGTWNGIFSGNQPLAGAFVLPSNVPATQISAPSCLPYDSFCTKDSECCSKSCFFGVGRCN